MQEYRKCGSTCAARGASGVQQEKRVGVPFQEGCKAIKKVIVAGRWETWGA